MAAWDEDMHMFGDWFKQNEGAWCGCCRQGQVAFLWIKYILTVKIVLNCFFCFLKNIIDNNIFFKKSHENCLVNMYK